MHQRVFIIYAMGPSRSVPPARWCGMLLFLSAIPVSSASPLQTEYDQYSQACYIRVFNLRLAKAHQLSILERQGFHVYFGFSRQNHRPNAAELESQKVYRVDTALGV